MVDNVNTYRSGWINIYIGRDVSEGSGYFTKRKLFTKRAVRVTERNYRE